MHWNIWSVYLFCVWLLLLGMNGSASQVSSVLPGSRSVMVGVPATAFATLINTGADTATDCMISPVTSVPANFYYQTTDPATNAPVGNPNTSVDIAAGGFQAFIIGFTPTAAFPPTDVQLGFDCSNRNAAPGIFCPVCRFAPSSLLSLPHFLYFQRVIPKLVNY